MRRSIRFVAGILGRHDRSPAPVLDPTFGSWDRLSSRTLAVCHPRWRGVRTAAHAFGDPVVETDDAAYHARAIVDGAAGAGVEILVVHGFPPGSEVLLGLAHEAGLSTRAVGHSSFAQHGAEAGEAAVMSTLTDLLSSGTLDRIGFVKAGMAEVFEALGYPAAYTPNRAPVVPAIEPMPLGDGSPHVGVFAAPFWRKNVVTQLGAVALIDGARAHVMERPGVAFLERLAVTEHGELPWEHFVRLQGSVDLNLCVTLSECHPLSPVESYLSGVPCLLSRTSALFRDDPGLWESVTVSEADDPVAIAAAAERLLADAGDVVRLARVWIARADAEAAHRWHDFIH
jgi:hypothetical protein